MKKVAAVSIAMGLACVGFAAQAADPIKLADVCELSGGGAPVGNNWKNAIDMAVAEINAAGGVLGRPLEVTHLDTQTNPGVSRGVMQKALDDDPYIVLGPIYSSATMVDLALTQQAKVPEFTGGAAAGITKQDDPYIFRMALGQTATIPKVVNYLKDKMNVKTAALVWVNDDYGKDGRDAFTEEAKAKGIQLVSTISTEAAQVDFSADVIKLKDAKPDVVFVYTHEEESARFLKEARKENLQAAIFGDTTLLDPKVIALAGDAANGIRGHLSLSAGAPVDAIQDFVKKFQAKYNYVPDHNAIQGYMTIYTIKYLTTKIGKLDREAFAKAMHGLTITPKDEPGILMETSWDNTGDIDRASFIAEIDDGKQKIVETLPKLHH
ncbi:MAG TPA: ABC transporter substrate-binding protein [Magnetospirillaceae bacterium]|jgi:branched-chain amino acid transport system substrate-binding protein